MTAEIILTDEQVRNIIEDVAWPNEEVFKFTVEVARAIEQAILQSEQLQATEAYPCRIVETDFETNTVTLEMQGKYTVSSGPKYLCDVPLYRCPVPNSQVNLDSLSVPTEEKTVEQHRAEFEAWVVSEFKVGVLHKEMIARYAGNNDLYHHAQTTQLWRAWKAAKGVDNGI